jgi:hypothetical protein
VDAWCDDRWFDASCAALCSWVHDRFGALVVGRPWLPPWAIDALHRDSNAIRVGLRHPTGARVDVTVRVEGPTQTTLIVSAAVDASCAKAASSVLAGLLDALSSMALPSAQPASRRFDLSSNGPSNVALAIGPSRGAEARWVSSGAESGVLHVVFRERGDAGECYRFRVSGTFAGATPLRQANGMGLWMDRPTMDLESVQCARVILAVMKRISSPPQEESDALSWRAPLERALELAGLAERLALELAWSDAPTHR